MHFEVVHQLVAVMLGDDLSEFDELFAWEGGAGRIEQDGAEADSAFVERLFQEELRRRDIPAPRIRDVDLTLNGKHVGVMTLVELPARELLNWALGFHVQVTESALGFGGIPVKYLGDGFLCFFTGPGHRLRAVKAAVRAKNVASDDLAIGLHCGDIYYGSWGHPDYATRDIIGDGVNIAFRAAGWTGNTESKIVATEAVMGGMTEQFECVEHAAQLKGIAEPMTLFEIRISDLLNASAK